MSFIVGDVVVLKSSSQAMTVTRITHFEDGDRYTCTWYDFNKKEMQSHDLPAAALEKSEE